MAFLMSSVSPTHKKNENKAKKSTKTGKVGLESAHLLLENAPLSPLLPQNVQNRTILISHK